MNGSGTVTAVNVFGQDGLVARDASGAITEYDFDQQGNVAHRTDSGGRTINASTYQAYGVESTVGLTDSDPFGYNARWGYYLDRETGLYLCQHRYYDPGTGRWINRDPIGVVGGVDLYQYTNSSPTLINDSSGLATWVQVGSFLGGYSHAYIQFDKPCMGSTSFGFWPASGSAPYGSSGGSLGVGSSSGSSAGLGSSGESSGGSSSSSASSSAGDSFSAGSSSSSSSASSSAGGLSQPGIIKHNDPHASDPPCEGFWSKLVGAHHDRAQNNDDAFERALCDCIKNSISHTPRYVFGKYVCGSWVAQMWACAKRKVNGG